MQYFLIFIKVIPYIISLVKLAEQAFSGTGTGADKKAYVTQAVQIILEGGTEVSTGGQKETWIKLSPLVSTLIDLAAAIYFPSNKPAPPDAG